MLLNFFELNQPISITAISSISPLGFLSEIIWKNYKSNHHFFSKINGDIVAQLPENAKQEIETLRHSNSKYKQLDDSVLFGIFAARYAIQQAGWKAKDNFGVNVGSSRGATGLFERYFEDFLDKNKAKTLSSPTTTLGNISSWIAHDLQTKGPEISHSITCSTALHAMLNGVAWIQSGLCDKFLVGGSEAPLTPFTIAQMKALKIYCDSERSKADFPCQALNLEKKQNTMILGEGAAMVCLEKGKKKNALAYIEAIGYATELLEHNASLSTNADCFQRSMKMALSVVSLEDVDVIVTHTPGTIKGDQAEYNAIKEVFGDNLPFLTNNKWKIGHTLGASGLLSVEMALLMLKYQRIMNLPYSNQKGPHQIKTILINAVGFGGNAVSILVSS